MLSNVIEGGRVRCQQYWPDHGSHSYGPFTVELLKEEHSADHTVRTLKLKVGENGGVHCCESTHVDDTVVRIRHVCYWGVLLQIMKTITLSVLSKSSKQLT